MDTVTLLHIGDIHLKAGPRQADRLDALDQAIAIGLRQRGVLGAWLVPGDLFDAKSDIESRNELRERFKRMAAVAPVLVCYGNHEAPGDLDIFGDLRTQCPIVVSATPDRYEIALPNGEGEEITAAVFALPYPTEAGLVGAGVPPAEIGQAARDILQNIFIEAGAWLHDAEDRGLLPLIIGHVNVAGAVTSTGQPSIGREIELDAALLSLLPKGCYKGLNHIHRGQRAGGAWYPGSICRLSWGEVEPKQVLAVDYSQRFIDVSAKGSSDMKIPGKGWDYRIRPIPLDVPAMWHVECRLGRDADVSDVRVTAGPEGEDLEPPDSWEGQDVRLRASYKQSEGRVLSLAEAAAKAMFAGARRFELEPICIPDRALRAPEVAAARTIPEKLEAWAKVSGAVLPADAAARAGEMESHSDLDAYAADVERRVAALADLQELTEAT